MANQLNLHQRINRVMQQVKSVIKTGTVKINDSKSYKAVLHDEVTSLLHEPFTENGIVVLPSVGECDLEIIEAGRDQQGRARYNYVAKVWVESDFINADDPSDFKRLKSFAYAIDSGDKAVGKAFSMAIKYTYLKALMLESMEDEESRDSEVHNRPQAPQQRPRNTENLNTKTFKLENQNQEAPILATKAQYDLMIKLGIPCNKNTTKDEAIKAIQDYNNRNKK